MKINFNNIFKLFLIILLLPTLLLSYKVHRSYVLQATLLQELNSNTYTENTLNRLINTDIDFPNLSVTALPMNGILARYLYAFDKNSEAIDLLNEVPPYKDYLYFNENIKAIIYNNLGLKDSSLYYSKMAFQNLPGNANHYEQYVKNLVQFKDSITLIHSFPNTSYEYDYQFSKIFLAAALNLKLKSTSVMEITKEIKSLYPLDSELMLMTDYVLYGADNVNTSIDLTKIAEGEFEDGHYKRALELFMEANKLNPSSYTNYENIGLTYYRLNMYEKAIPYLTLVIKDFKPKDGKAEYILGMCYKDLGNSKKACNYFLKSYKLNFKPAFSEYSLICK